MINDVLAEEVFIRNGHLFHRLYYDDGSYEEDMLIEALDVMKYADAIHELEGGVADEEEIPF